MNVEGFRISAINPQSSHPQDSFTTGHELPASNSCAHSGVGFPAFLLMSSVFNSRWKWSLLDKSIQIPQVKTSERLTP